MATERTAGFDQLVGRWEEAQHRAALVDGRHAYFIGRDGAGPIGFVIVRDWAARERVTLIKRIAVGRPGRGYGRRMAEGGRQRGSLGCLSRHPFFQGDSVFAIQRGAVSFFDDPAQAVTLSGAPLTARSALILEDSTRVEPSGTLKQVSVAAVLHPLFILWPCLPGGLSYVPPLV